MSVTVFNVTFAPHGWYETETDPNTGRPNEVVDLYGDYNNGFANFVSPSNLGNLDCHSEYCFTWENVNGNYRMTSCSSNNCDRTHFDDNGYWYRCGNGQVLEVQDGANVYLGQACDD